MAVEVVEADLVAVEVEATDLAVVALVAVEVEVVVDTAALVPEALLIGKKHGRASTNKVFLSYIIDLLYRERDLKILN